MSRCVVLKMLKGRQKMQAKNLKNKKDSQQQIQLSKQS